MDWSDDPMLQYAGNFIWPRIDDGIYINDKPAPPLYKVDTNPVVFGDGSSGTGGSHSSNRSSGSKGGKGGSKTGSNSGDGDITVEDCKNPINHSSRHEKNSNDEDMKAHLLDEKLRNHYVTQQRMLQEKKWHDQKMQDIQEYREAAKNLEYHAGQVLQKRDMLEAERFTPQGGSKGSSDMISDNTLKIILIVLLFAMVIIQAMTLASTKKMVNLTAINLLTENI